MKKLFLSFLIALGLLLPTVNNTANAAGHYKQQIIQVITDWTYFVTSGTEDGIIKKIEIIRLSTGETVRMQEFADYNGAVDLKGLPSGGYSARITCQYVTVTRQFKL